MNILGCPLPILEYHCISEKSEGGNFSRASVPPADFRAQVKWFHDNGYSAITLAEAFSKSGLSQNSRKQVVFTFDDGYLSTFDAAANILAEFGWKATVFCCPGITQESEPTADSRWGPPLMSYRQMRELADAGWDVAGHTMTHPKLPELAAEDQRDEIVRGREALREITDKEIVTFAYPHGLHDSVTRSIVEEEGFLCAVGTAKGNRHSQADRFQLRRVFMRPDTVGDKLAHKLGVCFNIFHRVRQGLGLEQC